MESFHRTKVYRSIYDNFLVFSLLYLISEVNFIKTNKFIDSFDVELKFVENGANGFSFEPPKGLH